jgi:hypothetical protein
MRCAFPPYSLVKGVGQPDGDPGERPEAQGQAALAPAQHHAGDSHHLAGLHPPFAPGLFHRLRLIILYNMSANFPGRLHNLSASRATKLWQMYWGRV